MGFGEGVPLTWWGSGVAWRLSGKGTHRLCDQGQIESPHWASVSRVSYAQTRSSGVCK